MSEMSKAARAAMKAKASRMGGKGDPKTKVDASSWSPPEMMNTDMKTGMRPLTRRAYRKGGKVIEGSPTAMRADRKQRKGGGRSLVTDLINRNVKKANLAREGGDAHVGGYKSGGDVEQDKKLVKKAFRQHDEHMHGGKHEDIKLKKGGRTKKADGGKMDPNAKMTPYQIANFEKMAADAEKQPMPRDVSNTPLPPSGRRIAGRYTKGGRTKKQDGGGMDVDSLTKQALMGPGQRASTMLGPRERAAPETKYEDWQKLQTGKGPPEGQGDKTSPPGGTMMPMKAKGGGTYYGGTRPTGGRMPKADGGSMQDRPLADKGLKSYRLKGRYGHIMIGAKDHDDAMREAARSTDDPKRENLEEWDEKANSYRKARKSGGRTKGKTNIVISINAGKPDDQQAMMPKMPTPSPMPVPPIAPPGMGAGMPPMPMPPPGPPPGMPPMGGPPGMPPMPRKSGGRAYRSYKDMDAGALGGMGRLEKVEIEHGKRVGRLSGGRARSYKDMDAGALGGMGRIEKIAIQKHKK